MSIHALRWTRQVSVEPLNGGFSFVSGMNVTMQNGRAAIVDKMVIQHNTLKITRSFAPATLKYAIASDAFAQQFEWKLISVTNVNVPHSVPLAKRAPSLAHAASIAAAHRVDRYVASDRVSPDVVSPIDPALRAAEPAWYVINEPFTTVSLDAARAVALATSIAGLAAREWGGAACGGVLVRRSGASAAATDFAVATLKTRAVRTTTTVNVASAGSALLATFFGGRQAGANASTTQPRTHAGVDARDAPPPTACTPGDSACATIRGAMARGECRTLREVVSGYVVWDPAAPRASLAAALTAAGAHNAIVIDPSLEATAASIGLKQVATYVGAFVGKTDADAVAAITAAFPKATAGVVAWLGGESEREFDTAAAELAVLTGGLVLPPLCQSTLPACATEAKAAAAVYARSHPIGFAVSPHAAWKRAMPADAIHVASQAGLRVERAVPGTAAMASLPPSSAHPLTNTDTPVTPEIADRVLRAPIAVAIAHIGPTVAPGEPLHRPFPATWTVNINDVWLRRPAIELTYTNLTRTGHIVGNIAGEVYPKALPLALGGAVASVAGAYAAVAGISTLSAVDESEGNWLRGTPDVFYDSGAYFPHVSKVTGVMVGAGPALTFGTANGDARDPTWVQPYTTFMSSSYLLHPQRSAADAVADVAALVEMNARADIAPQPNVLAGRPPTRRLAPLNTTRRQRVAGAAGTDRLPFLLLLQVHPGAPQSAVADAVAAVEARGAVLVSVQQMMRLATLWPSFSPRTRESDPWGGLPHVW